MIASLLLHVGLDLKRWSVSHFLKGKNKLADLDCFLLKEIFGHRKARTKQKLATEHFGGADIQFFFFGELKHQVYYSYSPKRTLPFAATGEFFFCAKTNETLSILIQ